MRNREAHQQCGFHGSGGGGGFLSGAGLHNGVSVLRVQTVTQVRVHSEVSRTLHVKYRVL